MTLGETPAISNFYAHLSCAHQIFQLVEFDWSASPTVLHVQLDMVCRFRLCSSPAFLEFFPAVFAASARSQHEQLWAALPTIMLAPSEAPMMIKVEAPAVQQIRRNALSLGFKARAPSRLAWRPGHRRQWLVGAVHISDRRLQRSQRIAVPHHRSISLPAGRLPLPDQ